MSSVSTMLVQETLNRLRAIPRRVWLVVGGAALGLFALTIWAAVALIGSIWTQLPQMAEAGKRVLHGAVLSADQALPGIAEHAKALVPGMTTLGQQAAATIDVSGSDIGPVERFPGLIRQQFVREPGRTSVRYVGPASLPAVVAHYRDGFAAAGYTQTVRSAAPTAEQHQFTTTDPPATYEISIEVVRGGLVAVTLDEITS